MTETDPPPAAEVGGKFQQVTPDQELLIRLGLNPQGVDAESTTRWPAIMTMGDIHPDERDALWGKLQPLLVMAAANLIGQMSPYQYSLYVLLEPLFRKAEVNTEDAKNDVQTRHGTEGVKRFAKALQLLRNATRKEFRRPENT